MSEYTDTSAELEEEARRREQTIIASEEASAQAAAVNTETGYSPDAEIAQAHSTGRQHDHSDTSAYAQANRRRRGPRR